MKSAIVENIKHVVVLMMENRSFDHLFGDFPGVNGIWNAKYNLLQPDMPVGPQNVPVYPNPINVQTQDPRLEGDHTFFGMMKEIFGPSCSGYIASKGAITISGNRIDTTYHPTAEMCGYLSTNINPKIMSYFEYLPIGDPGRLNILHTLAENYVLCDNWFCDTPSETNPNRFFMHAATNKGDNDSNTPSQAVRQSATIFSQLDKIAPPTGEKMNWVVYGWPNGQMQNGQLPSGSGTYDSDAFDYCVQLSQKQPYRRDIAKFSEDVKQGNLPFYTFICPSLNLISDQNFPNGNSMHPDTDVRPGENFIASVYNALVASKIWNNTLFIVTFDENGGIYDHVAPPSATPPDDSIFRVSIPPNPPSETLFDYSILGPRVPALLISPWLVNAGANARQFQIDSTQYQNTSIARFVQDLFSLQNAHKEGTYSLTFRDHAANSFANSSFWREAPSPGLCPQNLPLYVGKDIFHKPILPWGSILNEYKPALIHAL